MEEEKRVGEGRARVGKEDCERREGKLAAAASETEQTSPAPPLPTKCYRTEKDIHTHAHMYTYIRICTYAPHNAFWNG